MFGGFVSFLQNTLVKLSKTPDAKPSNPQGLNCPTLPTRPGHSWGPGAQNQVPESVAAFIHVHGLFDVARAPEEWR